MVSFQKLRLIRKYYGIAFGQNAESLLDDTSSGNIYLLSAIRNCITHSAGRIDPSFKKATERFTHLNSLEVGKYIQLDGEMVRDLRTAAAETGMALLNHVDECLVSGST